MLLAVGAKYPIEIKGELSIYLDNNGFLFTICFPNISNREIINFRENELTITFSKVNSRIAFFNFSIDEFIDNCDIAFSSLLTEFGSKELKCSNGKDFTNVFTLALVDSHGQILKALRTVGVSQEMAKAIYEVSLEQESNDLNNYVEEVYDIQKLYSPSQIVDKFKIAEFTFKGKNTK